MFLVRKIARAKWDVTCNIERGLAEKEISADAVTADLRTGDNQLSFWKTNTATTNEIEDVALAIAAAGNRLDKLDVVWLVSHDFNDDGLILKYSKGRTPVDDLADQHVDVCNLDYVRLGKVAKRVAAAIEDERFRRLSRQQIKSILATAINQGRLTPNRLAERLRKEVIR